MKKGKGKIKVLGICFIPKFFNKDDLYWKVHGVPVESQVSAIFGFLGIRTFGKIALIGDNFSTKMTILDLETL